MLPNIVQQLRSLLTSWMRTTTAQHSPAATMKGRCLQIRQWECLLSRWISEAAHIHWTQSLNRRSITHFNLYKAMLRKVFLLHLILRLRQKIQILERTGRSNIPWILGTATDTSPSMPTLERLLLLKPFPWRKTKCWSLLSSSQPETVDDGRFLEHPVTIKPIRSYSWAQRSNYN